MGGLDLHVKLLSPSLWPREGAGPALIQSRQTFTLEPSICETQVVRSSRSYQLHHLSFPGSNGFRFHPLPLWVLERRDRLSAGAGEFPNGHPGKKETNKTTATEDLHPPTYPLAHDIYKHCVGRGFCLSCSRLGFWHLGQHLAMMSSRCMFLHESSIKHMLGIGSMSSLGGRGTRSVPALMVFAF